MNKSLALAAEMAKLAPTALRLTKQSFRELTQAGFDAALEAAKAAQKEAYASGEPQAAMRKFLEARKSERVNTFNARGTRRIPKEDLERGVREFIHSRSSPG